MSFEDKVNGIIGLPYDKFEAHCWHLVEFLVPDAPKLEGAATSLTASVKHFNKELECHALNEVHEDDFINKDIVILGKNNIMFHAGVYYDGGVIHASDNGVVYQDMKMIKLLYSNVQGLRV